MEKMKTKPVKTSVSDVPKELLVTPAIKKVEREIKHDVFGHPYIEIEAVRGTRSNRKLKTIRVHPSLLDEEKRKKDMEDVTGKFKLYEKRGGTLEFWWVPPFLDAHPIKKKLVDGEIVTIPKALARHLQKNGRVPIHEHATDEQGKPIARIGTWIDRFDFFEISSSSPYENNARLVTVESL
jgi:hypothetical protein